MYEVGCLVALEDGLPGFDASRFDLYIGTSGGASVAALLASGVPVKRLYRALLDPDDDFFPLQRRHVLSFDAAEWRRAAFAVLQTGRRIGASFLSRPSEVDVWQELDRFYDSLPAGLFTMDGYRAFLEDFFRRRGVPDRFGALRRPLFVPANDLDSGHRVVFGQGPLQDASVSAAVCASSALPIFFAPVRIGDRDYVDGGIGKVAHIDVAVRWGADLLFVVNPVVPIRTDTEGIPTGHGRGKRIRDQGLLGVYNQAFRMSVRTRIQLGLKRFQAQNPGVEFVVLEPDEREATMFLYSPMNFAARRTILRYGYTSTLEYLERHGARLTKALAERGFGLDRGSIPPPA
jgi:predicted acylesterase/phospholipase RssA